MLANEEVTPDGRSDIGNYPVYRRPLQQWMLRITAFAERLLADLDGLDWPESIKRRQRNWIGPSDGAYVTFPVADETDEAGGADEAAGAGGRLGRGWPGRLGRERPEWLGRPGRSRCSRRGRTR